MQFGRKRVGRSSTVSVPDELRVAVQEEHEHHRRNDQLRTTKQNNTNTSVPERTSAERARAERNSALETKYQAMA